MIIYNPLARSVDWNVRLPVNGSHYSVVAPDGQNILNEVGGVGLESFRHYCELRWAILPTPRCCMEATNKEGQLVGLLRLHKKVFMSQWLARHHSVFSVLVIYLLKCLHN